MDWPGAGGGTLAASQCPFRPSSKEFTVARVYHATKVHSVAPVPLPFPLPPLYLPFAYFSLLIQ